jgi:hypothetical protein
MLAFKKAVAFGVVVVALSDELSHWAGDQLPHVPEKVAVLDGYWLNWPTVATSGAFANPFSAGLLWPSGS